MKAVVYIGLDGNKELICSEKIWIDKEYIGFQKDGKNNYARYMIVIFQTDNYDADKMVCDEFMGNKVAYIKVDDLIRCVDESRKPSMIEFFLKTVIEASPKVYLPASVCEEFLENEKQIGGN